MNISEKKSAISRLTETKTQLEEKIEMYKREPVTLVPDPKIKKIELLTIINQTIGQLENPNKKFAGLFSFSPALNVAAGERCSFGCGHCNESCTPEGIDMDYDKLSSLPFNFFLTFSSANFGVKGDPLSYSSHGKDIVDLISFLDEMAMSKITFSLPNHTTITPTIERLYDYVEKRGEPLYATQLSYHWYKDKGLKVAEDLNKALHIFAPIFKRISIPIYADDYNKKFATEIVKEFIRSSGTIFEGIDLPKETLELLNPECWDFRTSYQFFRIDNFPVKINDKELLIRVPTVRTNLEPEGRFAKRLKKQGIYEDYVKKFQEPLKQHHHCRELIKWKELYLEPNGDVRICTHYPALFNDKSLVTNLFDRPYEQAVSDLLKRQEREVQWVVDHLDDLVAEKVSGCKAVTRF